MERNTEIERKLIMLDKQKFLQGLERYINENYRPDIKPDGCTKICYKNYSFSEDPKLIKSFGDIKNKKLITFQEKVTEIINTKKLDNVEVYKKAYISKQTWSKVTNIANKKNPSKDTAFQICIGLDLNYEESIELLSLAGHSLSAGEPRDLCLKYCLEQEVHDIDVINIALHQCKFKEFPPQFYN